jgi:hypothetical protein
MWKWQNLKLLSLLRSSYDHTLLPGYSNHGGRPVQSQGAISELAREWPFGSELGATISVWKKITKILKLNLKS